MLRTAFVRLYEYYRRKVVILFIVLMSCRGQDYAVSPGAEKQPPGAFDFGESIANEERALLEHDASSIPEDLRDFLTTEPEEIQTRVDVALQRLMWGEDVGRCQIQVSFERRNYPPRPPEDNGQFQTEYPDEEGTCAFTRFDEQPPFRNNWYVSGDLQGPSEIYLHGEQVYTLELTTAEDGQLRYEWKDCNQEDFPFAEVLAIEIPESQTGDWVVPAVWIEEAFAVGPDIILSSPNEIAEDHRYHGYGTEDLLVEWALLDEVPIHRGEQLQSNVDIRLYNNQRDGWNGMESMICLPNAGIDNLLIPAEDISLFTLNDFIDQDEYYTALAVQSIVHSQHFEDPWGRSVQVRSLISEGGMMELITSE